jgi:hypothetical protein
MTADEMFLQEGYVKVYEDEQYVEYAYDPTKEYLPITKPQICIGKKDGYLTHIDKDDLRKDITILSFNLLRAIFTKYKEMGLLDNANKRQKQIPV